MSGIDGSADGQIPRFTRNDDEQQHYGSIVVVGGGCYGSYYVRQLQRAARAGALSATEIVVVDRDAECAVGRDVEIHEAEGPLPIRLVISEWREFFGTYLDRAADEAVGPSDAIVPSPLMPHLMGEWLVSRARRRFADRAVDTRPVDRVPEVPWERAGVDGTHYVSFATWMCPVNCVEPRTCPHTRDTRTWSLPVRIGEHARARDRIRSAARRGDALLPASRVWRRDVRHRGSRRGRRAHRRRGRRRRRRSAHRNGVALSRRADAARHRPQARRFPRRVDLTTLERGRAWSSPPS